MTDLTTITTKKPKPLFADSKRQRVVAESFGLAGPRKRKTAAGTLTVYLQQLHEAGPGASVVVRDSWSSGRGAAKAIDSTLAKLGLVMNVHAQMDESCCIVLTWYVGTPPPFVSRFAVGEIKPGMVKTFTADNMPLLPVMKDGTPNRTRGWRWLTTDFELWKRALPHARKYALACTTDHATHYTVERLQ